MARPDGYLLPWGVSVETIVAETARGFDITTEEIMAPGREPHVSFARACAMAVVREGTNWSYPVIGRYFGLAHESVIHAVKRVMADDEMRQAVRLVVAELSPPPRLFAVADIQEAAS